MPIRSLFLCLIAATAFPAVAQLLPAPEDAEKWNPKPPSADELAQIATIESVGLEIYRQDQLAWHATDALIAKIGERKLAKSGGGWVITNIPGGALVTVARREPGSADDEVLAEVKMLDNEKPEVDAKTKRALSDTERHMLAAQGTAGKAVPVRCSQTYNSATVPTPEGDWDIYLLAATTQSDVVPMGGHARIRVSADGTRVIEVEPYSKSCLMMKPEQVPGHTVAMMFATHVVSDLPAPSHVFVSLTYGPLTLGTRNHIWGIEKGKIRTLHDAMPKEPATP